VAVGAVVAAPERRAVVVTGEGCFQSSIQELATLAYNQLNVKMCVVNNNGYVSIRNTQQGYFNGFLVGTDPSCGVSFPPLEKVAAYKTHRGWTTPYVSAHGGDFLFDYGYAFRREEMSGVVREEFDMGQLLREAPQWLRDYREDVGAPDLESAVSVSAGWSVFAMRDGAVYNTYRVYPHSRLITPLFSGLLELLPNKE